MEVVSYSQLKERSSLIVIIFDRITLYLCGASWCAPAWRNAHYQRYSTLYLGLRSTFIQIDLFKNSYDCIEWPGNENTLDYQCLTDESVNTWQSRLLNDNNIENRKLPAVPQTTKKQRKKKKSNPVSDWLAYTMLRVALFVMYRFSIETNLRFSPLSLGRCMWKHYHRGRRCSLDNLHDKAGDCQPCQDNEAEKVNQKFIVVRFMFVPPTNFAKFQFV